MSLPWFPFHVDAYTGDTMHLTTEEHGAYLLMMLAYYRTGRPLPSSDRSLAALTKLPLDRWNDAKPALSAFFVERDGLWHHDRIDAEMLEASSKLAASKARAVAASAASHAKRGHKPARSQLVAGDKLESADSASSKPAPSQPQASSNSAHLHKQITLSLQKIDSGNEGEEVPESRGSTIDPAFQPDAAAIDLCHAAGATDEEIDTEVRKFVFHHREQGTWSDDWLASWGKWWERYVAHKAKAKPAKRAGAPRIEVNVTPPEIDWDWWAARFAKNQSTWSRQVGPEPGNAGCRCPADVLRKHGIDPKTGFRLEETE